VSGIVCRAFGGHVCLLFAVRGVAPVACRVRSRRRSAFCDGTLTQLLPCAHCLAFQNQDRVLKQRLNALATERQRKLKDLTSKSGMAKTTKASKGTKAASKGDKPGKGGKPATKPPRVLSKAMQASLAKKLLESNGAGVGTIVSDFTKQHSQFSKRMVCPGLLPSVSCFCFCFCLCCFVLLADGDRCVMPPPSRLLDTVRAGEDGHRHHCREGKA